jgi:hypothetical protein
MCSSAPPLTRPLEKCTTEIRSDFIGLRSYQICARLGGSAHVVIHVGDTLNRHGRHPVTQENAVRVRILGMVSVHANGHPTLPVEVAVGD